MTTRLLARQPARPPKRVASKTVHDDRFETANRVFFRLYQASNLMHRTGTRAVSEHGATTQQWAVMGALARPAAADAGLSVKDLMAFLCVSRQSLTLVLSRLERLGIVERARTESDGRVRRIQLTAKGRRTWALMLADIGAYYAAALQDFTPAEAEALFRLLDRLTLRLGRM
jgi:MarR family transcriptional regulator, organic hydroperoxide resistance regulator